MDERLTPMQVCEALIGPPAEIAAACGLTAKAPYVWRWASATRDAGDLPTARFMRRLLDHSDARGLGLTAEHLIRGATAEHVRDILAARAIRNVARAQVAAE